MSDRPTPTMFFDESAVLAADAYTDHLTTSFTHYLTGAWATTAAIVAHYQSTHPGVAATDLINLRDAIKAMLDSWHGAIRTTPPSPPAQPTDDFAAALEPGVMCEADLHNDGTYVPVLVQRVGPVYPDGSRAFLVAATGRGEQYGTEFYLPARQLRPMQGRTPTPEDGEIDPMEQITAERDAARTELAELRKLVGEMNEPRQDHAPEPQIGDLVTTILPDGTPVTGHLIAIEVISGSYEVTCHIERKGTDEVYTAPREKLMVIEARRRG